MLRFGFYFLCILAGVASRMGGGMRPAQAKRVSWWLGWVIYPTMVFVSLTTTFTRETLLSYWVLPAVELAIMLGGGLVGFVLLRILPFSSSRAAGTVGYDFTIGNYIFLPLPLAVALWGPSAAGNVVVAALGAEIAYWTVGVAFLSEGRVVWHRIFTPAVLSLLLGGAEILLAPPAIHHLVLLADRALVWIGAPTIPLAMFLLGYHLAPALRSRWLERDVVLVTLFRGVVVPAVVWAVFRWVTLPADVERTLFLVATMPVAVASVYMSDLFHGDPALAAKCVWVGHLFSLVSVPLWLWLTAMG